MKSVSKWLFLVMAAVLLAAGGNTAGARADVLYEPMDDFYEQHLGECSYECRTYIADAPGDELVVYESPESAKEVGRFANGTELFVTYLYTDKDGIVWAQTENWSERFDGWFPLEYAYDKYDGELFAADYRDQIKDESGQIAEKYRGKTVCVWDFPGGAVTGQLEMYEGEQPIGYYRTFTDEEGRKWGYCGYYYGWRDFWVCADAPTADESELYPNGKPVRDTRFSGASSAEEPSTEEPYEPITPKSKVPAVQIIGVLAAVAVVMIVSVAALRRMKKS